MCKRLILNFYNKSNAILEERIASYPYAESPLIEQIFDLSYSDGVKSHLLDIYRPINQNGLQPAIIDIHGGGWYSCYKEMNKHFCMELANQGFTVVSINYTLAPDANIKTQIREIFDFFYWLELSAEKYSIDLNKLFICGDSAGAQLASLALLTLGDNRRQDFFGVKSNLRFLGACFICGAFGIKRLAMLPFMEAYFNPILGKGYRRNRIIDEVDFFNAIPLDFPQTLLISSNEDFIKSHTDRAEKHLKKYGIDCTKYIWEKSETPKRKLSHVFNVLYPTWEESITTNTMITDFFKRIYRLREREENSDE